MIRPILLAVLVLAPAATLAADEQTPRPTPESQPSARRVQRLAWEKQTILDVFDSNGFDVEVAHEADNHSGPSASFFARRRS